MAKYNEMKSLTLNGKKYDSFADWTARKQLKIVTAQTMRSVNHRGYSVTAPENTIPAYILSRQMGFTCVEADVTFTSDGVAVLLHDSTIDRTSNGSGSIAEMTYEEASLYDYGSWKDAAYTGTRLPTFEEFLVLCKHLGLHPYIELKSNDTYTQAQITSLVNTVRACGMGGKVTWISFAHGYLGYVKAADPAARLGVLIWNGDVTESAITAAQNLQTGENEVFLDMPYELLTDAGIALAAAAGIPVEVWTVNSEAAILELNPYVTGVTSDSLIAGEVLYEHALIYNYGIDSDAGDEDTGIDITAALIDIDFAASGANTGTGGSAYDATIGNGGAYADGKFVIDGTGYLSVPTAFMAVSSTAPWTLALKMDTAILGSGTYSRFARGNNDIPAVYIGGYLNPGVEATAIQFKGACNFNTNYEWLADDMDATGIVRVGAPIVIGIRNDGTYVSIWVNGDMKAKQLASYYTSDKFASSFGLGDSGMAGWDPQYAEYSMLKLWDVALTDEEMAKVTAL